MLVSAGLAGNGKASIANLFPHAWVGNRVAKIRPTAAKAAQITTFWLMLVEPHWSFMSRVAIEHDKWSAGTWIISTVVVRSSQQHLCADKGYDYEDVHEIATSSGYMVYIKHRRRRNELPEPELAAEDKIYPARRLVVERALGWLAKRPSIRTRWGKKPEHWVVFHQFAAVSVLHDIAIFG